MKRVGLARAGAARARENGIALGVPDAKSIGKLEPRGLRLVFYFSFPVDFAIRIFPLLPPAPCETELGINWVRVSLFRLEVPDKQI